jgi:hypothetical protein
VLLQAPELLIGLDHTCDTRHLAVVKLIELPLFNRAFLPQPLLLKTSGLGEGGGCLQHIAEYERLRESRVCVVVESELVDHDLTTPAYTGCFGVCVSTSRS